MKRIESLPLLRFLAALMVVFLHYGRETHLATSTNSFIFSGPRSFSLFFVLSGFVLMIAHTNKSLKLRDFYVSRIARILPIYLVALFFTEYLYNKFDATTFFLNVTLLQAWFPPYAESLNFPSWSLSVQAFFYFSFPFILFSIKQSKISWKKLACIALGLYFFTQVILSNLMMDKFYSGYPSPTYDLIYYFPLSHFCSFLLGIAGGYVYASRPEWFNKPGFLPFVVLIGAIAINFVLLQYPDQIQSMIGVPLAYGASFNSLPYLFLILGLAYSKNFITWGMSLPIFVVLGEASYSLYIFQEPFNTFFNHNILNQKIVTRLLKPYPDGSFYLFVILLILLSMVTLYCIEKPGKRAILYLHSSLKKKFGL